MNLNLPAMLSLFADLSSLNTMSMFKLHCPLYLFLIMYSFCRRQLSLLSLDVVKFKIRPNRSEIQNPPQYRIDNSEALSR